MDTQGKMLHAHFEIILCPHLKGHLKGCDAQCWSLETLINGAAAVLKLQENQLYGLNAMPHKYVPLENQLNKLEFIILLQ